MLPRALFRAWMLSMARCQSACYRSPPVIPCGPISSPAGCGSAGLRLTTRGERFRPLGGLLTASPGEGTIRMRLPPVARGPGLDSGSPIAVRAPP